MGGYTRARYCLLNCISAPLRHADSSLCEPLRGDVAYFTGGFTGGFEGVRRRLRAFKKVLSSPFEIAACPKSHLMAKTLFIGDGIGARDAVVL